MKTNITTIRCIKGSIMPHCDVCNKLGPTILALASISRLILRKCDKAELYDNLFKS